MSYEATVEFKFNSTWTPANNDGFGSAFDDDFIPEEHFVITAPAADLSCRQYFKLFEKFMLAVGMSHDNVRSGAMSLVLNEWVNDADQRKACDEYEVTRNEDLHEKFKDWKKRDEEIESMKPKLLKDLRYKRFAGFTDEQLEQLADYGDSIYYQSND